MKTIEKEFITAKLEPSFGSVSATIIKIDVTEDGENITTVGIKHFSGFLSLQIREKDWISATEWVNKQLKMINKYSDIEVIIPHFLLRNHREPSPVSEKSAERIANYLKENP